MLVYIYKFQGAHACLKTICSFDVWHTDAKCSFFETNSFPLNPVIEPAV